MSEDQWSCRRILEDNDPLCGSPYRLHCPGIDFYLLRGVTWRRRLYLLLWLGAPLQPRIAGLCHERLHIQEAFHKYLSWHSWDIDIFCLFKKSTVAVDCSTFNSSKGFPSLWQGISWQCCAVLPACRARALIALLALIALGICGKLYFATQCSLCKYSLLCRQWWSASRSCSDLKRGFVLCCNDTL